MTLDEAIKHCEEVAEEKERQVKEGAWEKDSNTEKQCTECAEEHRQLAEWLKDYKRLLEQEPCEDCISRQAVIDSLHSKFADGFDTDRWWNSMSVLYAISKVPSVKPQEPTKTGHWIYTKMVNTGEIRWSECSECGNGESGCAKRMRYCPNCGIRMREVDE